MAARARTAQSVIARVESGETDPSSETLGRLLAAAGYEVRCQLEPVIAIDSHMLDDVERILRMSPEERLIEIRNVARFEAAAKRV
jgi:predicted transcriptional regulator